MPKKFVNDINIHYEEMGSGFPLVMIMGLAGNLDWWPNELINSLSQHFRVIIFDNRGAGRTDASDKEYSIPLFAEDTVKLMDALQIPKAHVLGISMGGMIAQEIALNFPERVEKLVLGCTNCGAKQSIPASLDVLMTLTGQLSTSPEDLLKIIFPPDFLKNNSNLVQEFVSKYLVAPIALEPFQQQLQAILKFDSFERLSQISQSTLILTGDSDILVPPENSKILSDNIPGSQQITYPGCGHGFVSQAPLQVLDDLISFLR